MKDPISHLLNRNTADVIVKDDLKKKLESGEKLRIYLGVDPTGPKIHLGHAVALRKLAEFQKLGHTVILLIGDFTAQIGDPTGKTDIRTALTHEEVLQNAETYKKQASIILDFDDPENPAELAFNSEWLAKFTFDEVIKLAAQFTVQQMLERDMFQERIKDEKPISVHEFLYPLMQGYDTVALEADVELGGTDQTFNMLAGRTLRKNLKNKEKHVMTVPLLIGTDGRKMSKSYHNTIDIDAPAGDQFGKLMSMKDELISDYYMLCTNLDEEAVKKIEIDLKNGKNPRDQKMDLAHMIVEMYHGTEAADTAREEFVRVFSEKKLPSDMPQLAFNPDFTLIDYIHEIIPERSRSDIKRLFKQGAVSIKGEKISDPQHNIAQKADIVVKVGKLVYFTIVNPQ